MGYVGVIWVFPKIGVPQNGWFMVENPIKMDDLGVPLFLETPISHLQTIDPNFLGHPSKSPVYTTWLRCVLLLFFLDYVVPIRVSLVPHQEVLSCLKGYVKILEV